MYRWKPEKPHELIMPLQSERTKFPGMKLIEAQVMRRWLRQHELEYDRFDFNVRVGPGRDPGPEFSEAVRRGAIASSQLRLDAIGWKGNHATLIECKNFAQDGAIAQLGLYAQLWREDNPTLPAPTLLLACAGAADGVVNAALAANVIVQPVR